MPVIILFILALLFGYNETDLHNLTKGNAKDKIQDQLAQDQTKNDEQLTEEEVSALNDGYCYGALLKAQEAGEMREEWFPQVIEKYKKEKIKECGDMRELTKDCYEKLSTPTRFFWGATEQVIKELSSSAPTTLLESRTPGNWPISRGEVIRIYCMGY